MSNDANDKAVVRFLPDVNLGALLQIATVAGGFVFAVFQAGQWIENLRGDLRAETQARVTAEQTLLSKITTIDTTLRERSDTLAAMQQQNIAIAGELQKIDHSFQHFYAIVQPQPRTR